MENKDNAQKGVFFSSLFKKNGKKMKQKQKFLLYLRYQE